MCKPMSKVRPIGSKWITTFGNSYLINELSENVDPNDRGLSITVKALLACVLPNGSHSVKLVKCGTLYTPIDSTPSDEQKAYNPILRRHDAFVIQIGHIYFKTQ